MASTVTAAAPIDSTALLADLDDIPASIRNGQECSAGVELAKLEPEARAAVLALLDGRHTSATHLCNVLARHGLSIRSPNLSRHRRRGETNGCRCPREN